MDVASYVVRQGVAGRSVGKALLVVGLAVAAYQVYRRWRQRRALKRLAGKVVLITGASSGLGEALARVFHGVGSKVILASRNVKKLQDLKFQLDNVHKPSFPPLHSPKVLQLDLSLTSSLPEKATEALNAFGRIDILINNAGLSSRGSAMATDVAVVRKIMEVNFFGTVALTRMLLPSMLEQRSGHIAVISSLQGKMGLPNRSSYAASKHALQGYFDSLRCEVASCGVQVTVVSPGYINTQLSVNALATDGSKHGVMDTTTAHGITAEAAAQQVLLAVARGDRDLVLASIPHHLALCLSYFYPSLLDWVLQKRAKIT